MRWNRRAYLSGKVTRLTCQIVFQKCRYSVSHRITVAEIRWTVIRSFPSEYVELERMIRASPPAKHPSSIILGNTSSKSDFHPLPSASTIPSSSYSRSGTAELNTSISQYMPLDGYAVLRVGMNVAFTHPPARTTMTKHDANLGSLGGIFIPVG